jgi:hypothetical protein
LYTHSLYPRNWRVLLALIAVVGLFAGSLGITDISGSSVRAASSLPCDIYAAGGTPCVAAHSTIRALFSAYNGNLYQVRRASDNTTRNIGLLSAGGYANSAAQDSFCTGTTCVITIIYDQSGHGNDLAYQGPGGAGGHDTPANATSESLAVAGNKVYSLYINPGNGYWHDGSSSGMPKGTSPQGAYMVTSGTHVNGGCCFDYGNSETDRKADTAGAMDAINFSTSCWFGGCTGNGPWVQADLEWGLFPGGSSSWNPNQRAFPNRYVTAMLKNNGTTQMALKGGNAQSGSLTTLYKGSLPNGYNPMKQQGAIDLGSGGDCCATNNNLSLGTFYEGAIVAGYPSDATDDAVQANIVAAGYGSNSPSPTPTPTGTPIPNSSGYAVNAGGDTAGSFDADNYYSGGNTYSTTSSIDTSGVSNPAPQAVYQTERYGDFSYSFPNLTPGAQYTVRLHFDESYWSGSGQRLFNVAINGQQVLSNFDIYATAGAAKKAIVEQETATADANGQITIQFTSLKDNAKVNGIEVLPASSSTPTPTPTPTPIPTPTSTPIPTPTATPTATPTPPPTGVTCSVHYTVTNQWSGGFGASVTITNTGSTTINGWNLTWTFANGQTITQLWNGNYTQSGSTASVTNASYNGTIAPGGSTNFGFNGSWNGSNINPTSFTLNGVPCSTS